MKIAYIKIENFRGLRFLNMSFGERMNVFVGENGAGKSSVLSALKYLMSWFAARMVSRDGAGISIREEDITSGKDFCRLEIGLDNGVSWKLFRQSVDYRDKAQDKTDLTELTAWTDYLVTEHQKSDNMLPYPIVCHYGVNRAVAEVKPKLAEKSRLKPEDAYDRKLNNGANFNKFFDWFREREDIENATFRKEGTTEEDVQLKTVKAAIEHVMPGFDHFHVSREPRSFMLEKGEVELSIEQLSDGEKCYLTLIGDIARLLSMTNPKDTDPLSGSGCVMIDEVDLHLHPQWQTEIVSRLTEIFPNCQFFVTSHSPFVVSNVKTFDNDKFIVMRQGEAAEIPDNIFGQQVSEILTEFFSMASLRNGEVQAHIDTVWNSLQHGDFYSDAFTDALEWLKRHLSKTDIEFAHINLEQAKLRKMKG